MAGTLRASAGYPFTPYRVTGYDAATGQYTMELGAVNSARDYVPRLALDARVAWDLTLFGRPGRLFLDASNLIAGPSVDLPDEKWVGMDTARIEDRRYTFQWFTSLVLDFGVEVRW